MYSLIQGKQIHYELMGEGSPILLVHGWGGTMESLRVLGSYLSSGHKVILVDLPGFGLSENPEPDWGAEQYATVLIELLENLKIKKIAYFGHSFGGALGLLLGAKHRSTLKALIICNSALKRPNKKIKIPSFIKLIFLRQKNIRIWFYRIFFPNSDIAKYPHLETNFKQIMQQDLSHLPEQVTIPTLIVWGENDTVTPVTWAHELHAKIKDSTLVIVPGAGHGLPLTQPERVGEEIKTFL